MSILKVKNMEMAKRSQIKLLLQEKNVQFIFIKEPVVKPNPNVPGTVGSKRPGTGTGHPTDPKVDPKKQPTTPISDKKGPGATTKPNPADKNAPKGNKPKTETSNKFNI